MQSIKQVQYQTKAKVKAVLSERCSDSNLKDTNLETTWEDAIIYHCSAVAHGERKGGLDFDNE